METAPSEAKDKPVPIVILRTQSGSEVILSEGALKTYGQDYIESLANRAGQDRLLLADEHILKEAKDKFPDSRTPLLDQYSEFFEGSGIEQEEFYENSIERYNFTVHQNTNGTIGTIIMPSADDIQADQFKYTAATQASGLREGMLGSVAGSSLEWAKTLLDHEAAHLKERHDSGRPNESRIDKLRRFTVNETTADLSLFREYNTAAGLPTVLDTLKNYRIIGASLSEENLKNLNEGHEGGRYNAAPLDDFEKTGQAPPLDADRMRYATAYRNTLVQTLVSAAEKQEPEKLAALFKPATGGYDDSPKMNIYAANVALLESGMLNHAPEIKRDAELFVSAVEESSPRLKSQFRHEIFSDVITRPETQADLEKIRAQYDPNPKLEKLPSLAPVQVP